MALFQKIADDIHAPIKRKFERRKAFSPAVNHVWSSDLIDYQQFKADNNGFAYILVCIDVFSRFARCIPLKTKTAKEMSSSFQSFSILPKFLWCDQGNITIN